MLKPALLAASAAIAIAAAPPPLAGTWAGDGFRLAVTENGTMVQNGCSHGKIGAPIFVDSTGAFTARGYYNPPSSGYRLKDVAARDHRAVYRGTVHGSVMTLTVSAEGQPAMPTRTLKRGGRIKFAACK